MDEDFEVIGKIESIETIAVGPSIRELHRLQKAFGHGRWRKLKGVATVRLEDGTICRAELHWYEAHGIGRKKLKINTWIEYNNMNQPMTSYVLCIDNGGYPESLEVRKIYPVLPDEKANERDYIRVVDETGEDYLYPSKYFVSLSLSAEVIGALAAQSTTTNR